MLPPNHSLPFLIARTTSSAPSVFVSSVGDVPQGGRTHPHRCGCYACCVQQEADAADIIGVCMDLNTPPLLSAQEVKALYLVEIGWLLAEQ